MNLVCLLPFAAALLGGCISNIPADLAVASVQAVDWRDQDEMPGPGASALLGLVPTRDLALSGESVTGGPKPPRLLLKVEFTTATNLANFVTDNAYTLGVRAYFCDRPGNGNRPGHGFIGLSLPNIYQHGQRLGPLELNPIDRQHVEVAQPVFYYFYANVANNETRWINQRDEGFNLLHNPHDICFYVMGGNNSGSGYWSNTVVIPKSAIIAALEKRPPGF